MITLLLDAPEPWTANLRAAARGWPAGIGLHSDPAVEATVRARVRDPGVEQHVDVVPDGAAVALLSSRVPMSPPRLTAWARRTVLRLPLRPVPSWPTDEVVSAIDLPPDASAVRTTRNHVLRMFPRSSRVDDLVLAASELAANAVQHGHGPTTLAITIGAGGVVIEVGDRDPHRTPRVLPLDASAPSGRGMAIVDVVTDSWGVVSTATEKIVWCEFIDLAPGPAN